MAARGGAASQLFHCSVVLFIDHTPVTSDPDCALQDGIPPEMRGPARAPNDNAANGKKVLERGFDHMGV